jgi:hypothetical protein
VNDERELIDVGDAVYHEPTGEEWLVAAVDGERVYWCGYPFGGYGDLKDCSLIYRGNRYERDKLLHELADGPGNEVPRLLARARLGKPAEAQP